MVVLFLLVVFVWVFCLLVLVEFIDKGDYDCYGFVEVLCYCYVLFGVIGIFCYVGVEVLLGSYMVNYLVMLEIGYLSEVDVVKYVLLYWGGVMVGCFVGLWIMVWFLLCKLLVLFVVINIVLVVIIMVSIGSMVMYSVIVVGLFNLIMFLIIFVLGIEWFGLMISKVFSLLIMVIVGGVLIL